MKPPMKITCCQTAPGAAAAPSAAYATVSNNVMRRVPTELEGIDEGAQSTRFHRTAQTAEQCLVVVNIVNRHQYAGENFSTTIKVMQACTREALARVTPALGIEPRLGRPVVRVPDFHDAARREEIAVPRVTRRQHAIEHIHAARDCEHEVFRRADTHQI